MNKFQNYNFLIRAGLGIIFIANALVLGDKYLTKNI